jgi:hypothetical protein
VGTSRTSPWHAGHARSPAGRPFRQGADARHPPGHRLRRSVPPADTRQWLAGRGTWRTARPSGRPDTPVRGDRPADGSGPGPDGGGQAADTFSAQRPTMRLASWLRPTMRPAHPGHDRTGRQCACSLRPTPAAPERPPAWSPSDVRAVVSGVHDGRHDRTGSGHACPVVSGRTPSPPAGTPAGPEAMRTGERTNGTRGIRTSSIATTTKAARRDTPSPLLWGRRCGLQPRSARRWQHCQRDGNHGSDQAAAWCRSSVQAAPRRTVLHPRAILAQIILTDRSVRNKFGFSSQERRTPGCPPGVLLLSLGGVPGYSQPTLRIRSSAAVM